MAEISTLKFNDRTLLKLKSIKYGSDWPVVYIINNNGATREEISNIIGRSKTTAVALLNRLIEKELIIWSGTTKNDAYGKYIIKQ